MKKLIAVLSIVLAACGGGGDDTTSAQQSAAPGKLLIVGNSLTTHPPLPDRGWLGNWGMAASTASKDYAHLVAASLGMTLDARHTSPLEMDPAANASLASGYGVTASDVVVVELGDNVADLSTFRPYYAKLLDDVKGAKKLACTSTWWRRPVVDDAMRAECEARGGRWVFIGDIYPMALDPQEYADASIQAHPHDASMRVIADRVAAALR